MTATDLLIDFIETQPATINTVSGNVITDPDDTPPATLPNETDFVPVNGGKVSQVQFGSTIVLVPTDGSDVFDRRGQRHPEDQQHRRLHLHLDAGHRGRGAVETDAFTYTLKDGDGDTDTAILRIDCDWRRRQRSASATWWSMKAALPTSWSP